MALISHCLVGGERNTTEPCRDAFHGDVISPQNRMLKLERPGARRGTGNCSPLI
jgi:hypothetical protein